MKEAPMKQLLVLALITKAEPEASTMQIKDGRRGIPGLD